MSDADILGIFAKEPLAGRVKTRLAAQTSPEFAAKVADAVLRETAQKLKDFDALRFLVYAPPEAERYFAELAAGHFILEQQTAGDLGQRLTAFLQRRFEQQARRMVIVGADSPTLPIGFIRQAFRELDAADVVIGPATDGGYYLIGCSRTVPPIFDGIEWGGPTVLAQTADRIRQANLRLALLPPWYDIDTKEDWEMLRGHCRALRLAGVDPGVPSVEALFAV